MSEEIGELFNTITTIYINDRPVQAKLPSALQDSVIRKIDGKYYIEYGILDYIEHLQQKVEQQDKEINRLNNIINELEKYIVEEIDDAQEELNIILQGNNLDYKNECTKEFNCIKNALDMLLDKLKELKENNNE